jgi:hypothetical protein
MRHLLILFFLFFIQLSNSQIKTMNKGYIIYNLGVDTTFIGYYQVENNNFQFRIIANTNALTVTTMSGSLYPNGELKEVKGYSYTPSLEGEGKRLTDYHAYINNDSTFFVQVRDGKETVTKYSAKGMIANAIGTPFLFMLPVLTPYAPKNVNEVINSYHLIFGQNRPFTIKRLSPDVIEMGSQVMGYFKIHVDKEGRLKSIDGIGSSWNVKGSYFDELDMDEYIKRFIAKAQQHPLKPLNQKDSIVTKIDDVDIRIDYSRPSIRGRVIFGEVVPWNRIWRTGANEPTKITINKSIYFRDKELPPGEYSIFTLPAKEGWTFIINKQTNMWGTDHNPDYDFIKVPMQTAVLDKPVDLMEIEIEKTKNGGILNVAWEKTKAYVSFTTKK